MDIADAVRALAIAVGNVNPTPWDRTHGDVAPLVNKIPAPDGRLDLGDAVVILRKAVGLATW